MTNDYDDDDERLNMICFLNLKPFKTTINRLTRAEQLKIAFTETKTAVRNERKSLAINYYG